MPRNEQAQQILRKGLQIVLIIAVPVIGIILGSYVGGYIEELKYQSDLTWQSLGKPQDKPIKLLGLCEHEICVETTNGQRYRYNSDTCDQSTTQACWQVVSSKIILPIVPQLYNPCTNSIQLSAPPIETIQLLGAKICGSGSDGYTYYALLEDGSVWKWEHWRSGVYVVDVIVSAIIGAFIGLAIGISIAIFVFVRGQRHENRTAEQAQI